MWVKIDDHFPDHPKVLALGEEYENGVALHIRALCYCGANLTDGFVPARLFKGDRDTVKALVTVGLWEPCGGGYMMHDYLDYNPTRQAALEIQRSYSERGKKGADARWKATPSDTPEIATAMAIGIANPMAEHMAERCPVPVPVPRPVPKDKPLSLSNHRLPDGLLGYWSEKVDRDPRPSDLKSLKVIVETYGEGITKLAIGQAIAQGSSADNYALITTIAKGERA